MDGTIFLNPTSAHNARNPKASFLPQYCVFLLFSDIGDPKTMHCFLSMQKAKNWKKPTMKNTLYTLKKKLCTDWSHSIKQLDYGLEVSIYEEGCIGGI